MNSHFWNVAIAPIALTLEPRLIPELPDVASQLVRLGNFAMTVFDATNLYFALISASNTI